MKDKLNAPETGQPAAAKPETAPRVGNTTAISPLGIDLSALRLSQDYMQMAGVEELLTTVPVRKPNRPEYVRVHPEKRFDTMLLELKEEKENYLIAPGQLPDVYGFAFPVSLRLAISAQNVLFIWPLRLPGEDGRTNSWYESALEAAERAKSEWISLRSCMPLSAYRIYRGEAALGEPQWPDKSMDDLLAIAFRNRVINDPNHPVIKRLQGRA